MTTIVTLLTDGLADWETALLNAVAKGYYGVDLCFASPLGKPVTSMGGMRVMPDVAMEDIDVAAIDALVISGGTIWQTPGAPDIGPVARAAHERGRLVAGICDGTLALARTGLLDGVAHTSNGVGYLAPSGYAGANHYQDVPGAVTDGGIVTAPATAPVGFMVAVLAGLGMADDQLLFYAGLHAAEHAGARPAA